MREAAEERVFVAFLVPRGTLLVPEELAVPDGLVVGLLIGLPEAEVVLDPRGVRDWLELPEVVNAALPLRTGLPVPFAERETMYFALKPRAGETRAELVGDLDSVKDADPVAIEEERADREPDEQSDLEPVRRRTVCVAAPLAIRL